MAAAKPKEGKGLALIFGEGGPGGPSGEVPDIGPPEEDDMGPSFAELAMEVFPDVDPEQLRALLMAAVDEANMGEEMEE